MRILITGASGQLGNELRRLLESGKAEIGPIPEEYRDAEVVYTDTPDLDITNEKAVMDAIKLGRYDLVINCAAMTNVDGCEANENTAKLVNAIGAWNLARATKEHGIPIVHVSTDYVFAGNEPGERVESDPVNPISAYGRTKLEGEKLVASANNRHHIVRTAWLYGYVGKNFAKTMLRLAESHDEVTVVDDQLGNPTSANDLAYEILKIALTNDYGIWHVTNEGTCSWADFAEAVLANTNCKVNRCTSQEYKAAHPESANRPAFSSLKNKHLESTIGNEMRPWQEALAGYMDKLAELGA
ncbi:dTDP-4-dehydrorhamnose reductase [Adlercreutzia sp. ZJ304]|uniref:dTDP-4-dehydrorhamnose reductase n=1 Tax=Adlercreutzia sp. ZJ304 TaxID=2709791 RepID=UPI0013EAAB7A|nr:dTDP-4-dehydrorhamnose reductase [Adlercreutzia sp. ZJ304]